MIKSKKGAEIAMNTIIIIILAVLVLLVVIIIFTGGASTLNNKIAEIFGGQVKAMYDKDYVKQTCEGYCENAKNSDALDQPTTSYCNFVFKSVDINGDGKKEGDYVCDYANFAPDLGKNIMKNLQFTCPGVAC